MVFRVNGFYIVFTHIYKLFLEMVGFSILFVQRKGLIYAHMFYMETQMALLQGIKEDNMFVVWEGDS